MTGRAVIAIVLLLWSCPCAAAVPIRVSAPAPAGTTRSEPVDFGPDVVMLNELVSLYQPVPFSHRRHAEMAQMWSGCSTCHHRPPHPATHPAATVPAAVDGTITQDEAEAIPACKTCHAIAPERPSLRVPSLKGAYHRQCLNCHREWAGANQCSSCHAPVDGAAIAAAPMPDDIVGRMHPPIAEPDVKHFRIRVAPVAGPNVFFRHREHVEDFGVACSSCHRRDTCGDCHASTGNGNGHSTGNGKPKSGPRPMQIGRTWRDSHVPCTSCHLDAACTHCHYRDDQPAPPAFEHARTGQTLDADHETIECSKCHDLMQMHAPPTCGDTSCHLDTAVTFPNDRPGSFRAATAEAAKPATTTTAPATRPTIIRIRRGGI